jgi:hypothetical protein
MATRRRFLQGITLGPAAVALPLPAAEDAPPAGARIRDRLWISTHVAGSHNNRWGLPGLSRMTPAEGAFYLNVPNLIMIAFPSPSEPGKMLPTPPYDPYLISFRPLQRVVWSIVGAGGRASKQDLGMIRDLAAKYPNITGVHMDDFLRTTLDGARTGVLLPRELAFVKSQLSRTGRNLSSWVGLYSTDFDSDLSAYLNEIDVVTFWTWHGKDIESLEAQFARAERAAPKSRKLLGCYLWDYGDQKPIPTPLMEKQCQLGFDWLRQKRIEGIIFHTNCVCDLGLDAVEWTRDWIRKVGYEKV